MNQKFYYKVIFLLLLAYVFSGCAKTIPQPLSKEIKINTPKKSHKLTIKAKKVYAKDESLKFSIDTGKTKGYVYVVYVDKKGDTAVLSSKKSTKKKKSGKLNFPKDFRKKNVKVSKDCKNCKKEKTTVYVLLSTEPIENINSMSQNDLLSLNSRQVSHKNRSISLTNESEQQVIVNKIEFFVE
jgi:hypothetical protein